MTVLKFSGGGSAAASTVKGGEVLETAAARPAASALNRPRRRFVRTGNSSTAWSRTTRPPPPYRTTESSLRSNKWVRSKRPTDDGSHDSIGAQPSRPQHLQHDVGGSAGLGTTPAGRSMSWKRPSRPDYDDTSRQGELCEPATTAAASAGVLTARAVDVALGPPPARTAVLLARQPSDRPSGESTASPPLSERAIGHDSRALVRRGSHKLERAATPRKQGPASGLPPAASTGPDTGVAPSQPPSRQDLAQVARLANVAPPPYVAEPDAPQYQLQHSPQHQPQLRKVAPYKLALAAPTTGPVRPPFVALTSTARRPSKRMFTTFTASRPVPAADPAAKRIKLRDNDRPGGGDEEACTATAGMEVAAKTYTDDAYQALSSASSSHRHTATLGRRPPPGHTNKLTRVARDPSRTRVCPTFASGIPCENPSCRLRHDVPPEHAQPLCKYFQRAGGQCYNFNCPFRHVKVNPRATPCPAFDLLGYCSDELCPLMHRKTKNQPSAEATPVAPHHHSKNRTLRPPKPVPESSSSSSKHTWIDRRKSGVGPH